MRIFSAFKTLPFNLVPEVNQFISLTHHQQCYDLAKSYIEHHDGVMKVIGDVGCGKTLIAKKILNYLCLQDKKNQSVSLQQQQRLHQADLQSWFDSNLGVKKYQT